MLVSSSFVFKFDSSGTVSFVFGIVAVELPSKYDANVLNIIQDDNDVGVNLLSSCILCLITVG